MDQCECIGAWPARRPCMMFNFPPRQLPPLVRSPFPVPVGRGIICETGGQPEDKRGRGRDNQRPHLVFEVLAHEAGQLRGLLWPVEHLTLRLEVLARERLWSERAAGCLVCASPSFMFYSFICFIARPFIPLARRLPRPQCPSRTPASWSWGSAACSWACALHRAACRQTRSAAPRPAHGAGHWACPQRRPSAERAG